MSGSKVTIRCVNNSRGEKIEVGFVVTVMDMEHVYGTGEVIRLRGTAGQPWFALVRWEMDSIDSMGQGQPGACSLQSYHPLVTAMWQSLLLLLRLRTGEMKCPRPRLGPRQPTVG